MPRLSLSFQMRRDDHGVLRLFSIDHSDLFVSNMRTADLERLIQGIPHSLLLANTNDQVQVLIPAWKPVRSPEPLTHQPPRSPGDLRCACAGAGRGSAHHRSRLS